jgi:hypothetical protein
MTPWYNWNIFESGVKHHKPQPQAISLHVILHIKTSYYFLGPNPPSPNCKLTKAMIYVWYMQVSNKVWYQLGLMGYVSHTIK